MAYMAFHASGKFEPLAYMSQIPLAGLFAADQKRNQFCCVANIHGRAMIMAMHHFVLEYTF